MSRGRVVLVSAGLHGVEVSRKDHVVRGDVPGEWGGGDVPGECGGGDVPGECGGGDVPGEWGGASQQHSRRAGLQVGAFGNDLSLLISADRRR